MAEIHIEKKKSSMAWLWILLAILALILIVWWLWPEAEVVEPVAAVTPVAPITDTFVATPPPAAETPTIGAITASPQAWVGREFSGEVNVVEVPTDRGFWVEQDGQRMFALVVDQPREQPVDINPGQRLRITSGTVRDAAYLPQLPGDTLTSDTEAVVRDQPVYLVVNEDNITFLDRPAA